MEIQDILKAIDATPAEIVYVLPNNKNIIMAAEQTIVVSALDMLAGGQILGLGAHVLDFRQLQHAVLLGLVQGAADPDSSEEDNTAAMAEGFANVRTSEVTYAARDSDFDGFAIHQGDYLALEEHPPVTATPCQPPLTRGPLEQDRGLQAPKSPPCQRGEGHEVAGGGGFGKHFFGGVKGAGSGISR